MSANSVMKLLGVVNSTQMANIIACSAALNVASMLIVNNQKRQRRIRKMIRILQKRRTRQLNRNVWVQYRSGVFWERDVANFDAQQFKECFRMTRASFAKVVQAVVCLERVDTAYRKAIPLGKRVAIALYALGSSAEYRTISVIFGVGRSTVGEMVIEFTNALYAKWGTVYINAYPMDQNKLEAIVKGFEELGYPQCIGAIDGSHIEVSPRKDEATDYFNYKGWYSIILLAAVDYRYRFTYVNVGLPGRNSDSFVYNVSALKRYSESCNLFEANAKSIGGVLVPVHLIGDSAFKLTSHIVKPYPFGVNQPAEEKLFNYKLSKCRRVVENAFGHLKKRFRRVGKGLEVKIDNAPKIVRACCVLHNFLCNERDAIPDHWREDNSNRQQPNQQTRERDQNAGKSIRDALAQHFFRTDN